MVLKPRRLEAGKSRWNREPRNGTKTGAASAGEPHQRKGAKAWRGKAATKRKRLQRRDAEDAESRRAFSLTTDGHGSRRAGRIRARHEFRELTEFSWR